MDKTVVAELMAREEAVGKAIEAQRELVRLRLAEYRANPDEPVASLADIKQDLVCHPVARLSGLGSGPYSRRHLCWDRATPWRGPSHE